MRGGGRLIAKLGGRGTAAGPYHGPAAVRKRGASGRTQTTPVLDGSAAWAASRLISAPVVASDGIGIRLVVRPDRNGVTDAGSHPEHEAVAAVEAHGIHARHVRHLRLSCILRGRRLAFLLKLPVGSSNPRSGGGWLLFTERREPLG